MTPLFAAPFTPETLDPAALAVLPGAVVVEFGTNWCGVCRRTQPILEEAFEGASTVRVIKVEDGPGKPLGRAFGVKLWPTLVFLRDGVEKAKLVRPNDIAQVRQALAQITG